MNFVEEVPFRAWLGEAGILQNPRHGVGIGPQFLNRSCRLARVIIVLR